MSEPPSRNSEFSKGWKILLAAVVGVACGASPIPFNMIGFTIEPILAESDWSRTQILLPITIFGVIASLLSPFFGSLADKYGVRKVALLSLIAFGTSFAAIALTPSTQDASALYIYYALWMLVGFVSIGSTPITWSRAVNLWFFKQRGLALGVMLLGTSAAAFFVPQIAVFAIDNYGWRAMFVLLGLLPLLIALPIGYLLFREPRPEERPPELATVDGQLTGVTLGQAIRDYRFWLLFASIAIIAAFFGGVYINLPAILSDRGLTAQNAASVFGVLGIGIIIGQLATGALLDRFWQGYVAFPLLCLPALACYVLLGDTITLPVATLAGFFLGFAAGAEGGIIAYLAGRYFGMANYSKIYGFLYVPFGLFSAGSPLLYAYVRDTTGSYDPMLSAGIVAFIIGGGVLVLMGKYPVGFPADKTDLKPASAAA